MFSKHCGGALLAVCVSLGSGAALMASRIQTLGRNVVTSFSTVESLRRFGDIPERNEFADIPLRRPGD